MTLSVDLFRACCASLSKIATFASLDPLFGPPTGKASKCLKQHNILAEDIRGKYLEALQKAAYTLELAFQESEGLEENVLIHL